MVLTEHHTVLIFSHLFAGCPDMASWYGSTTARDDFGIQDSNFSQLPHSMSLPATVSSQLSHPPFLASCYTLYLFHPQFSATCAFLRCLWCCHEELKDLGGSGWTQGASKHRPPYLRSCTRNQKGSRRSLAQSDPRSSTIL